MKIKRQKPLALIPPAKALPVSYELPEHHRNHFLRIRQTMLEHQQALKTLEQHLALSLLPLVEEAGLPKELVYTLSDDFTRIVGSPKPGDAGVS